MFPERVYHLLGTEFIQAPNVAEGSRCPLPDAVLHSGSSGDSHDPVNERIDLLRRQFPDLSIHIGTAGRDISGLSIRESISSWSSFLSMMPVQNSLREKV